MSEKDAKRIVLTGATRGLGKAMVQAFIEKGHLVFGCGRSAEQIQQLQQKYPAPHRFAVVDIAQEEQVKDWAEDVLRHSPVVDLIVNNAALINKNNFLWKVPPEEFSKVIDVNIKGSYYVIYHFLPAMLKRQQGVILNFSSGWGRSTSPEVAPYCTTKWAIEGMTQALAQELPTGIAAVALSPGVINTEMLQSCFQDGAESYPSPEEWAKKAVPYLLSLTSRENGQSVSVPL